MRTTVRIDDEDIKALHLICLQYNCLYGDKPNLSMLLRLLAKGTIKVSQ
jgi:hypothetical protein